jgi:hypothetical protein
MKTAFFSALKIKLARYPASLHWRDGSSGLGSMTCKKKAGVFHRPQKSKIIHAYAMALLLIVLLPCGTPCWLFLNVR